MQQLWSWGLAVFGLTSLYLAGKHDPRAWYVGLFTQCLWVAYSLVSRQYGFLASAAAYMFVYVVNIWRGLKKQREDDTQE